MRDDIETAYHLAEGQCIDAMYALRRLNGHQAIACLKSAIRIVERGQRAAEERHGRERARLRQAEWLRYPDGIPIPLTNLQPEERDALFGKNHVERTTPQV